MAGISPWSRRVKTVCSLLILFHVVAVFVAPFSGPPPSSIFGRTAGDWFAPYLRSLFIYNGYRFFAPNPGPSHLVRYEIDTPSGEIIEGRFPDRDQHWPRLLYHRHFMLSETLFQLNSAIPPQADFDLQQAEMAVTVERLREDRHFDMAADVEAARQRADEDFNRLLRQQNLILKSIADELAAPHKTANANSPVVRLYLAERPLPLPDNIQEALRNRANGAEPTESRSKTILLVDDTRWIEQLVWPEQESANDTVTNASGASLESIDPTRPPNEAQNEAQYKAQSGESNEAGNQSGPPSIFKSLLEPGATKQQGRAGV